MEHDPNWKNYNKIILEKVIDALGKVRLSGFSREEKDKFIDAYKIFLNLINSSKEE